MFIEVSKFVIGCYWYRPHYAVLHCFDSRQPSCRDSQTGLDLVCTREISPVMRLATTTGIELATFGLLIDIDILILPIPYRRRIDITLFYLHLGLHDWPIAEYPVISEALIVNVGPYRACVSSLLSIYYRYLLASSPGLPWNATAADILT